MITEDTPCGYRMIGGKTKRLYAVVPLRNASVTVPSTAHAKGCKEIQRSVLQKIKTHASLCPGGRCPHHNGMKIADRSAAEKSRIIQGINPGLSCALETKSQPIRANLMAFFTFH
jgi:hypothetical protein